MKVNSIEVTRFLVETFNKLAIQESINISSSIGTYSMLFTDQYSQEQLDYNNANVVHVLNKILNALKDNFNVESIDDLFNGTITEKDLENIDL